VVVVKPAWVYLLCTVLRSHSAGNGQRREVNMLVCVWRLMLLMTFAVCVIPSVGCGVGGTDPVTKPQAIAFARAVNIRRADVPGMSVYVAAFETKNGPPYSDCTTNIDSRDRVAAMESPWLLRSKRRLPSSVRFAIPVPPVEGVHSVVYVMREPVIASSNVASGRRATTPECLTRLRTKETSGRFIGDEQYKLGIRASSIPFPLAGVAGYGLRVQGTLAAAVYHLKMRPTYYEDTFGFAVGASEIVLVFTGVERPFPSGEARRLLSLIYGRAKAHALS
jgi:hypothetical protein